jgi:chemotaxis protein methyltransferase CheR
MNLSAPDFQYVAQLLKNRAAIVLEDGKDYLVEARLRPLAQSEGLDDVSALVAKLRAAQRNALHDRVVEAMTTNETTFFRDHLPFELLRKKVLPEIIARKSAERRIAIWSAACSSGQEPYSLAMILREHFPQLVDWRVDILSTDLASSVLERAKSGVYKQLEVNRGLPIAYLQKYFEREGAAWKIDRSIRSMIDFRLMNLIEPWPPAAFDVIFMRNVLIYFDVPTKRELLGRARGALARGGYFFLGSAETTLNLDDGYVRAFPEAGGCYQTK